MRDNYILATILNLQIKFFAGQQKRSLYQLKKLL